MIDKKFVIDAVDSISARINRLGDDVWDHPETAFTEYRSAALHIEALKELGFEVQENLADIPTAFSGRWGSGRPVIGILGEFDALSGLSQEAGLAEHKPVIPGGNGHGCGHNLFGAASIGAAYAVKEYLKASGMSGTVIYFGCPGEEGGSGKAFMARDGVFDGLDAALAWHPAAGNQVWSDPFLGNFQVKYKFNGIAAHAGACPELGRSALDAVELMNVGVQYLREHIISDARIHYAVTDTGGFSPNVVQAHAEVLYLIRAPKLDQVREIYDRVNHIAHGAAEMTGTSVEIEFIKACSNFVPNTVLNEVMQANMEEIGAPKFDEADHALAKALNETVKVSGAGFAEQLRQFPKEVREELMRHAGDDIYDFVMPLSRIEKQVTASTDVGDVSWICPTAQVGICTMASRTPGHAWQLVAQGKSGIAHKGTVYAAKVMAGSAVDILNDPELLKKAKEEHEERLDHQKYVPPIPKGVRPQALQKKK